MSALAVERLPRHPRILDPVLVWDGRGTIVRLAAGHATIDADDELRVTVPVDRLRWVADREVWVIDRSEPPEPEWLHESPDFREPEPASESLSYHDWQARR